MLPNMQVSQKDAKATEPPGTPAATATTSDTPTAKPAGKPLDQVEQSMLTRQAPAATPPANASAAKTPTSSSTTPAQAKPVSKQTATPNPSPTTPKTPTVFPTVKTKRYMVVVGNYHSSDEADAQKAALILAGFEHAKVQSYKKENVTWYRAVIGNFASQDQAQTVLGKLQQNQFTGAVQPVGQ